MNDPNAVTEDFKRMLRIGRGLTEIEALSFLLNLAVSTAPHEQKAKNLAFLLLNSCFEAKIMPLDVITEVARGLTPAKAEAK